VIGYFLDLTDQLVIIIIIIIMISDRAEAEACYARAIGIGSA
jgi:hypothetical protein